MKYLSCLLLYLMITTTAIAQLEYSPQFTQLLEATQLILSQPLENQYKNKKVQKNDLFDYHYAIKKKKGDLEIRYAIEPWITQPEKVSSVPHITTMNLVATLASNEEDAVISYHILSDIDLKEHYNADWGLVAYFRPKLNFSDKQHCKMLCLFSEGKGIVNVFYLFDEITEELENQKFSIMFEPDEN